MAILKSQHETSTMIDQSDKTHNKFYERSNLELEITPNEYFDEDLGLGYDFSIEMRYKGKTLINKEMCKHDDGKYNVRSWYQQQITLLDTLEECINDKQIKVWESDPNPDMVISFFPNRDYPNLNKIENGLYTLIISPNTGQYENDDDFPFPSYGGFEGVAYIITASENDFIKFFEDLKSEFRALRKCDNFPFSKVKPTHLCYVCWHIVEEQKNILKVVHNDAGWYFLCGEEDIDELEYDFDNLTMKTYKYITEYDRSISEIAKMGKNNIAVRKDANSKWEVSELFPFIGVNPTDKCKVSTQALKGEITITKVIHNKSGWYFLCDESDENDLSNLSETTFATVYAKQPDLSIIGGLVEDRMALKDNRGWTWNINKDERIDNSKNNDNPLIVTDFNVIKL